jgi:hypothetical protein
MILLDTSVLSRVFRRRRPGPQEGRVRAVFEGLLTGDTSLALPGIVLQEVLSGIRTEEQFLDLERRLLSSFAIIHPTTTDCVEAARLRNKCLTKGLNASGPDCLIATLAVAGDHELFTLDHDFRAISKLIPLKLSAFPDDSG